MLLDNCLAGNWETNPNGREAVMSEWTQLKNMKCWDEASVTEYQAVKNKAIKDNRAVHFDRLFELCHIKHSELPESEWKFKGRVVFAGNAVTDEFSNAALFQDLQSSASLMSASKMLDYVGMMDGNSVEQSDAQQAYTQALLMGILPHHVLAKRMAWQVQTAGCQASIGLVWPPFEWCLLGTTLPNPAGSSGIRTDSGMGVLVHSP